MSDELRIVGVVAGKRRWVSSAMTATATAPVGARSVNGWPLPPGRWLPIEGRGSVFVREVPGPPGAPVVVLLHGLGATSGLQFAPTMNQLGEEFRVIAVDMRTVSEVPDGPRGLFEGVADDVASVLAGCGLSQVIVVGYSIGGLVARVLVRRHPELVAGLVFAATFDRVPQGRWMAPARAIGRAAGLLTHLPRRLGGAPANGQPGHVDDELDRGVARWLAGEIGKLHPGVLGAAVRDAVQVELPSIAELGQRPLAFIVTTRDRVIPPRLQRAFAATAPEAPVFEVDGGHAASGLSPDRFGPAALAACRSIHSRVGS
jgi:3-oxoadipate enol-lactonase